MEEDPCLQFSLKRLRDLSEGAVEEELEATISKGIRLLQAGKGFLLCSFIVHDTLSDENENWHVGAISSLIDNIGSLVVHSVAPTFNVSVDLSISFYSTAKVQEEVEIEAKVVGDKGKMTSVVVEVRKKESGQIVALGKQWMSSTNVNSCFNQASKL